MPDKVLLLGSSSKLNPFALKARQLGLTPILAARSKKTSNPKPGDNADADYRWDSAELLDFAKRNDVAGILPAHAEIVSIATTVASELGLPAISEFATQNLTHKLRQRNVLAEANIKIPRFRGVESIPEIEGAAREFGLPVMVKPADAQGCRGVRLVDYTEDLPLAFWRASRCSPSKTVLIEEFIQGREYETYFLLSQGRPIFRCVARWTRADPPYCHAVGRILPRQCELENPGQLYEPGQRAIEAMRVDLGLARVAMVVNADQVWITDVGLVMPDRSEVIGQLFSLAFDLDVVEALVRLAVGAVPGVPTAMRQAAAISWLDARSGVVRALQGVAAARSLPGVHAVHLAVTLGDILGHVVDEFTRDQLGYVVACGESGEAARQIASQAKNAIQIVTRPTLEEIG
ncbi:MAG: ATP-grasp domain-containing protein [Candidatus Hydrogenedentes bacterium]|nr:ATP-grasp domain-containing protein [Candidatus Hydrogenedentota bacterium]